MKTLTEYCSFDLMLTNAFCTKHSMEKFAASLKLLAINNIFVMTFVSVPNWWNFYF